MMQASSGGVGKIFSREQVNDYLWFGYRIPEAPPSFLLSGGQCADANALPSRTPSGAKELLSQVIGDACESHVGHYLVPVSGGWDSRILLSELCEHVESRKIRAITFGVPGALDFDLGAQFANHLGVKTERLDLSATPVTWVDLIAASKVGQGVMPTISWPNLQLLREAASENESVLSGFIGDFINGGHDRQIDAVPGGEFFGCFAKKRRFASSARLISDGFIPRRGVLICDDVARGISPKHAMFMWYRVLGYTAPAILGQEMDGWVSRYANPFSGEQSIFTPFTDRRWVDFWMGASQSDRYDQALFFRMVKEFYPVAYAFPSKDSWGVKRNANGKRVFRRMQHRMRNGLHRIAPWLPIRSVLMDNYIDFQWAFRKRDDYIAAIEQAIAVLKQREVVPWLDLDRIWREHYRGKRDHAHALQVLLGLAVNLEVHG